MALTRYRPDFTGSPEREVEDYLRRAESAPASWRSSSGDPAGDFAGERRRYDLLEEGAQPDAATIRRCFLFNETFSAIRQNRASESRSKSAVRPP
jgi:hypothetical protein